MKVAKVVGIIATVVAVGAGIIATFGGLGIASVGLLTTISAVAGAVAAVANSIAMATQKPPGARGSVNEVLIGSNMPVPYSMGRSYVGGNQVYDNSAGTKNSDRSRIFVGTHGGPIFGFEQALFDYASVSFATMTGGHISGGASGYYSGFLWADTRKGLRPDTALLAVGGRPAFTGRSSASKLSGMAAWMFDMKFDEKGERWASGIPATGMVAKWVFAYDPRKDTTYPGGSGSHRWNDESTWEWTDNPGLHGLTYARGRYMGSNDVKVVGVGLSKESIDLAAFVELANVCDANSWKLGGTIYEGPGISKWNNLKTILDAAAAKPVWVGGLLTLSISAPKTALDTITKDDLVEGEVVIPAMKPWKDKFNTIVPRYRSEAHRWEYVQAAAVSNSTYLTEDGEPKTDERQYDLIQDKDQAAQRAAYDLANDREYGVIQLPCKPRLRVYRPGEALNVDLGDILDDPDIGVQLAVVTGRTIDPESSAVTLELVSETAAKHAFALGKTGTAPPSPTIPAAGDVDQAVADMHETDSVVMDKILTSSIEGLTFSIDATGAVTVSTHTRIYTDKSVSVTGDTVAAPSGAVAGDLLAIGYHQQDRSGGAVTYEAVRIAGGIGELPKPTPSDPYWHPVAAAFVPSSGTGTGGSGAGSGGGGGGGGGGWSNPSPEP